MLQPVLSSSILRQVCPTVSRGRGNYVWVSSHSPPYSTMLPLFNSLQEEYLNISNFLKPLELYTHARNFLLYYDMKNIANVNFKQDINNLPNLSLNVFFVFILAKFCGKNVSWQQKMFPIWSMGQSDPLWWFKVEPFNLNPNTRKMLKHQSSYICELKPTTNLTFRTKIYL